ncbi:MAG: DUF5071 domain-containing protein [Clostridia bacterium]|nr:DUF5071 domain-containing protein [Clostridia bacterium]
MPKIQNNEESFTYNLYKNVRDSYNGDAKWLTKAEGRIPLMCSEHLAIDTLEQMPDERLKNIFPDLLKVLSQPKSPLLGSVLQCMRKRENLFFPLISDILRSDNENSKYWVMSQLIPAYSPEHREALKSAIQQICFAPSASDTAMMLSDCAEECLLNCFGTL